MKTKVVPLSGPDKANILSIQAKLKEIRNERERLQERLVMAKRSAMVNFIFPEATTVSPLEIATMLEGVASIEQDETCDNLLVRRYEIGEARKQRKVQA